MSTQALLPGTEPTAKDLYDLAVARPLDEKIQQAIGLLRIHEPADGYYLAYSGGKDSGVILELARMAGVRFEAHYNVTTLDAPELIRYIKREHKKVFWHRQPRALLTEMVENTSCKGPPTRLARWCCEEYKEQGGNGQFKIIGVRGPESPRRAATWRQMVLNRRGGHILCPILYWTEDDVWEFQGQRGIPYCCLYDEGFTRLGCIGCPLGGPKNQRIEFDRWPKYEQLWRRAFYRFWDRWHGVPTLKGKRRWFEDFGDPDAFFEWWISGGKKQEDVEPCQSQGMFL